MSEAELHLLAGRLQGAKRAAADRGELRFPLPVGYVYDDDGDTVIDPDEEVPAAVATCSPRSRRRVGLPGGRRVRRAGGSRSAPTAGRGPGSCAGAGSPTPGCWASWPTRPTPAPTCSAATARRRVVDARRDGSHRDRRAAPRRVAGPHPRPPPRLHQLGRLPGQRGPAGRQPHQRRRPPAPRRPRLVSGHRRLRSVRAADVHPLPPQRPRRLRVLGSRADQVATAPAGRCAPPPWTTRSPTAPGRPHPRRGRPGAGRRRRGRRPPRPHAAGPRSWRSNGPATKPNAPNAPSTPANRRTGWSPAPWKPAGKPSLAALAEADKPLAQLHAAVPPLPVTDELRSARRRPAQRCGTRRPPRPGPQTAAAHPDRRRHRCSPNPDPAKARVGIRWHTGATDELVVSRHRPSSRSDRTDPAAIELARRPRT